MGCAYREEDVAAVLDRFSLKEMFGGIEKSEILATIFNAGDLSADE